ncbi:carbohydrate ABC transporter substrate-binding protein [Paenibacillus segetis]|uniref:Carbohydrate ABC transporter substrate-binding protein n=1 Tax=Paenibacillus segetis TaxID=1325360 RepID=A0ABQ1Y468_9BACL|nr:carbohydrate ABC transporter substrate-binding protein [Paenibacillus segetis]GGH10850.1 hypothetical protein GCM10008013_02450 [Paenibacillus segetis]
MKKKRLISSLLVVSLLSLGLVGCGNSNNNAAATTDTNSKNTTNAANEATGDGTKTFENKELNIAVFQGGFGPDYWNEIVSKFESAYPGVKVNMTINPKVGDVIRPQIVAGNPPDFLSISDTEQSGIVLSLIKEKGLLDISDVFESKALDKDQTIKDMILPGMLDSTRFQPYQDGKIYLAPFNAGPMGLIYNKTLFAEKGWEVPETWDEFFALGDELNKEENYLVNADGSKTKRALFTYQGIYPDYLEEILYPAIASAGGTETLDKIYNYEEGSFKNDTVKKVLDIFYKISKDGYLMDGTVALNHTQSQTDMMMGKSLFIVNGNWMENEMKDSPREAGFEFGMTPVPVFNKGDQKYVLSSYEQFSIPAKAKNPELAKEFLKFLYTDESVKLFAEKANGAYALNDAKELSKPYLTKGVYDMFDAYNGSVSILQGWQSLPKGSKVSVVTEMFKNTITPVMTGQMTTDQWMDNVEKAFAQIRAEKAAAK